MFAIETSMLPTVPAQAATADGIVMSGRRADMWPGAGAHAENRLDSKPFRNRRYAPAIGSAGVRVM